MITANARTNEAGYSVNGADFLGVSSAKTESFCIDKSGKFGYWHEESLFERKPLKESMQRIVLGDLLGAPQEWGLIAHYMQESGINLRTVVEHRVYKPDGKAPVRELWTDKYRYKVHRGRVYGHKRR